MTLFEAFPSIWRCAARLVSKISGLQYTDSLNTSIKVFLRAFGNASLVVLVPYVSWKFYVRQPLEELQKVFPTYLVVAALAAFASRRQPGLRGLSVEVEEPIRAPVIVAFLTVIAHLLGAEKLLRGHAPTASGPELVDHILWLQALYFSVVFAYAGQSDRRVRTLLVSVVGGARVPGQMLGLILAALIDFVGSLWGSLKEAVADLRDPVARFARYRVPFVAALLTRHDRDEWIDRAGPRFASLAKFVKTLDRHHGVVMWEQDLERAEQRLLWQWCQLFLPAITEFETQSGCRIYELRKTKRYGMVVGVNAKVFDALWGELRKFGREHPIGKEAMI